MLKRFISASALVMLIHGMAGTPTHSHTTSERTSRSTSRSRFRE